MTPDRQISCSFDVLRERYGGLWDAAQDHPFVHGLADGSLDRKRFSHYLKQDYAYLQAYSRALNLAAAKAPDLRLATEFTALAHETLGTEMQLHRDYCSQFEITSDELESAPASPVCQAYGDFCIATAATGGCLELLAALIPCGVGYAEIGLRLQETATDADHPYRQWIETYASAGFQAYAAWMKETFDTLGQDCTPHAARRLAELFVLGCRYEWLFWEMAWTMNDWPELTSTEGEK